MSRDQMTDEIAALVECESPSGDTDACRQLALRVPDEHGLRAEALEGQRCVAVVIRSGEDDDGHSRCLAHDPSASSIS